LSSQLEILGDLQDETAAIKLGQIAEKLDVKPSQISAQVNRYVENGLISKTEEGEYLLTPEGQAELAKVQKSQTTQEAGLATDYQVFMQKGKLIGIPENVVSMTAEHVWNGEDYKDLNWLWEALGQMNIRADLKNRWWHSFRTYLDQGITPDLKEKVAAPTSETGQRTTRATGRDYIIANDEPQCAIVSLSKETHLITTPL